MKAFTASSISERNRQNELADRKKRGLDSYAMGFLLWRQAERMLSGIGNDDSVLDVGCGLGDLTVRAAERTKGRVLGIDVSDRCVEIAQSRLRLIRPNARATVADIQDGESVPEDAGAFDRIVMKGVVHHLEQPVLAFRTIFDLLNPGGVLVLLEGNVTSLYRRFLLVFADLLIMEHEASQFPHSPPEHIASILKEMGFIGIEIDYIPGLFAPLAHLGIGGPIFWEVADRIDRVGDRLARRFFGWWALIRAGKS